MLKQDKFLVGILLGVMFPVFFWIIVQEAGHIVMDRTMAGGFSFKLKTVLSIASNAIPATVFFKSRKDNALRGVILVTFILVFTSLIVLGKDFFNS